MDKKIVIYTDGACSGNPGKGGYGVVITFGDHQKELSQAFAHTTNNRMELLATIVALEHLKTKAYPIQLYTDSRYIVNAVEKGWLVKWIAIQFKNKKNEDLWRRFWKLYQIYKPQLHWIKGHAGHTYNERCDALAVAATQQGPWEKDYGYEALHPPSLLS